MTKIDIKALRELHEKATPGEWTVGEPLERSYLYAGKHHLACLAGAEEQYWYNDDGTPHEYDNNAAFIAATHNALPALLDRIEELEGALRAIDDAEDDHNAASVRQACIAINALTPKEPT